MRDSVYAEVSGRGRDAELRVGWRGRQQTQGKLNTVNARGQILSKFADRNRGLIEDRFGRRYREEVRRQSDA